MGKHSLTQEQLSSVLAYDRDSASFRWIENRGSRARAGEVAGSRRPDGYYHIGINGVRYLVHHLVWMSEHGEFPQQFIDHIDGNPSNNHISNLRECVQSQNLMNKAMQSNNTSGFRGVSWSKKDKVWCAEIWAFKKKVRLGYFKTKELAALAYNKAATAIHGEFARLNEVAT